MFDFATDTAASAADLFTAAPSPKVETPPAPAPANDFVPQAAVSAGDAAALFGEYATPAAAPGLEDPKQAGATATRLASLPAAQQAEALGKLDDAELGRLAANAPPEQRKQLDAALARCNDPEQRVRLWAAMATAEAARDVGAAGSQVDFTRLDEADQANLRRQSAALQSIEEIAREKEKYLEAIRRRAGAKNPIQAKHLDELFQRKAKERQIEQKYGVRLENDSGAQGATDQYTRWTDERLAEAEAALSRLPADALGRGEVNAIRLHDVAHEKDGEVDENTLGDHDDKTGTIHLYARTLDKGLGGNVGDTSRLAGTDAERGAGALEMTLTHEIGHAVLDADGALRDKVEGAAGFREEQADALPPEVVAGLSETGVRRFEHGGRIYVAKYGRITSVPVGNIPTGGAHSGGAERDASDPAYAAERRDPYAYAKDSPDEYGAEMYTKALHVPELVHQDFVADPAKRVEEMKQWREMVAREVEEGRAYPRELADVEARVRQAEEEAGARREQFRTMREEVFGLTPEKAGAARARVANGASSPEKAKLLAEYDALAAQAMTPEQLERVTAEYEKKLR